MKSFTLDITQSKDFPYHCMVGKENPCSNPGINTRRHPYFFLEVLEVTAKEAQCTERISSNHFRITCHSNSLSPYPYPVHVNFCLV